MTDRASVDDMVQRVGLAALMYHPEIHVDEPTYSIEQDVDWCVEPLAGLPADLLGELRTSIGRTITKVAGAANALTISLPGKVFEPVSESRVRRSWLSTACAIGPRPVPASSAHAFRRSSKIVNFSATLPTSQRLLTHALESCG